MPNNIRAIRKWRNMSQAELAKVTGIARPYISVLENKDKSNPSLESSHRLAEALGVTVDELFFAQNVKLVVHPCNSHKEAN